MNSKAHEIFLKVCMVRSYFNDLKNELIENDGCPSAISYLEEVEETFSEQFDHYTVNPWCQEKKDN